MISSADVYEGVELYAGSAFEGDEHGICVWVFKRDDVVSGVEGRVAFCWV